MPNPSCGRSPASCHESKLWVFIRKWQFGGGTATAVEPSLGANRTHQPTRLGIERLIEALSGTSSSPTDFRTAPNALQQSFSHVRFVALRRPRAAFGSVTRGAALAKCRSLLAAKAKARRGEAEEM